MGGAGALRPHRPPRRARRGLAGRAGRVGRRDADGSASSGCATCGRSATPTGRRTSGTAPLLLTATSAGPGGFPTGHCSVWSLDPETFELEHRADLFLRRGAGCTATTRRTCSATATGGCWRPARGATSTATERPVAVTLAELDRGPDPRRARARQHAARAADRRASGRSASGTRTWCAPTTAGWSATSARTRYFRFHPASRPARPRRAVLRAVATEHRETEGTTLVRLDGEWRVLASDKRPPGPTRCSTSTCASVGTLDAAYPTNIPWPTLVALDGQSLLIGLQRGAVRRPAGRVRQPRRGGDPASSQSVTLSSGRTALRAEWIRDLTVPSGTSSRVAISL